MKKNTGKLLSIIPLLLLLGIACYLGNGTSTREEDLPSVSQEPVDKEGGNLDETENSNAEEKGDDIEVDVPKGYRTEPTMTYSPDTKVFLTGEEYGVTNEQYQHRYNWGKKENAVTGQQPSGWDENVKKENVYGIGEEVPLLDKKVYMKVNKVDIYDTISEFDRYYFGNGDMADVDMVLENGKLDHVTRCKWYELEDGTNSTEKDITEFKFIVIECTFTCDANWVERLAINNFRVIPLVEENGEYIPQYRYEAQNVGKKNMEITYSGTPPQVYEPCMFDKPIAKRPSSFFHTYITKDEVIECKIGYFVDVDYLDNMYVYYKGTANAIYTDSCLQKFIKLF